VQELFIAVSQISQEAAHLQESIEQSDWTAHLSLFYFQFCIFWFL